MGCSGQCDAGPSHGLVAAAVGEAAPAPGKAVGGLCVERRLLVSCLLQSRPGQRGGATGHQMHRLGLRQAGADGCLEGALAPGPDQQGLTASPASPPTPTSLQPCRGQVGPRGRLDSSQHTICQQSGARLWFHMPLLLLDSSAAGKWGASQRTAGSLGCGACAWLGLLLTGEKGAWPDPGPQGHPGPWTMPLSLS